MCLKNHSSNLRVPLCGIFRPNSVVVARYDALIRTKSPTNCDAHLAESLFQTRSRVCLNVDVCFTNILVICKSCFAVLQLVMGPEKNNKKNRSVCHLCKKRQADFFHRNFTDIPARILVPVL